MIEDDKIGADIVIGAADIDLLDEDCGPSDGRDMVDRAIDGLVNLLTAADYEDDSALDAVFDAMEKLLDTGVINDTPDMDVSDEDKLNWISKSVPLIKDKLKQMGLEF